MARFLRAAGPFVVVAGVLLSALLPGRPALAAPQGKPDVMASLLKGVEARSRLFTSADAFYLEEVHFNHALPGGPAEQNDQRKDALYQKRLTLAGRRFR